VASQKWVKFLINVVLCTPLLLLIIDKSPVFSFIVSPPKVEVICSSPGKTTFTLQVINTEKKAQSFKVYLTDLKLTPEGRVEFPPPGEEKRSCAEWIEVKPSRIFLQPFETEGILCNINVQKGYEGEFCATVMVEFEGEAGGKEGKLKFKVFSRVAIPVFLLIKDKRLTKKISILPIKVDRSPQNVFQFTVPVKNEGNVHLKVEGEAIVRDEWSRVWFKFPLEARGGTIFPESIRYFKANVRENLLLPQCFLEISTTYKAPYEDKTIETKVIFPFDFKNYLSSSIYLHPLPFVVNPPLVDIIVSSPERKSIFLEIGSLENTAPLHFRVSLRNINVNKEGEPHFLDVKSSSLPTLHKVEVVPDEFVVLPGEKRRVKLNLDIPDNVKGEYYEKVVFHSPETEEIPFSYGTTLFLATSDKLSKKCRLLSLKVIDVLQPQLVLRFKNTGNVYLKIKGDISLQDEKGDSLLTNAPFDQGEFIVFPSEIVNLTVTLPYKIPSGKYIVYLKVFSGEKQLLQKKEKITVR